MYYLIAFDLQLISLELAHMSPVYLDLLKMFAGCVGWVGGLTLFMYLREQKKKSAPVLAS